MQTDELSLLAKDFARRMSALDWLTDALFLAGMYPSTGPHARAGQRTIEEHVILIGPTADRSRPFRPLHLSTRGDKDWIRVSPYLADVLDMDLFHQTIATRPRPTGDGKDLNILVVHYTRRGAAGGLMRCFLAHHEEMDLPGASEKLADDAWVHSAFSLWLDDAQPGTPPQAPASATERVEVHRALIESQRRYMRHMESPSVDLMVELPELERHQAAERVSEALGNHPEVEFVHPTSTGTYVFISDGRSWPGVVDQLVEGLDRVGQAAVVTAPPARDLWEGFRADRRSVTAMMAYPMELAFGDGPLNPSGVAVRRWGVAAAETERLLGAATRWASLAGSVGQTGGAGPVIPATSEDAAELVRLRLQAGQLDVGLIFRDASADIARTIGVDAFGQVSCSDIKESAGPGFVDEAVGLGEVIRAEAARLDIAMIRPVLSSGPVSNTDLPGGSLWIWNRHLWSSRVYDAHGIQLLTDQHLEHARDLSGWLLEKVADHRWLVTARDLQPWYGFTTNREWHMAAGREDSAPDFLVEARHDFGDMILTKEIADAHPVR